MAEGTSLSLLRDLMQSGFDNLQTQLTAQSAQIQRLADAMVSRDQVAAIEFRVTKVENRLDDVEACVEDDARSVWLGRIVSGAVLAVAIIVIGGMLLAMIKGWMI